MRLINNIKLGTDMGSTFRTVSSLTNTPLVPTKKDETKMIHTIISLSTDNHYFGTIDDLVSFVNNHPDCRANDYTYEMPHNIAENPNPNFKLRLEQLGYSFDICGRAIEGGK